MQNVQHKICGQPSSSLPSPISGEHFGSFLAFDPPHPSFHKCLLSTYLMRGTACRYMDTRELTFTNAEADNKEKQNLPWTWWWRDGSTEECGIWWVGGKCWKDWSWRAFFFWTHFVAIRSFLHPDWTHAPSSAESSPLDQKGSLWKAFLIRRAADTWRK